jgi:two-component system, cell cycle response regulator
MDTQSLKILLIEDNPVEVLLMRALLEKAGRAQVGATPLFTLVSATTLGEGLERLSEGGFDLILLDLSLPDSEGLNTLAGVKAHGSQIPVVVLTWLGDEATAVQALQLGAQDYLVKGQIDPHVVVRAIRYAVERHRLLQNQSLIDDLTGLYNLRGFRNLAEQNWKAACRSGNDFLVLYADLDNLKTINDHFGHAAGSEMICRTADVLRDTFRTSDIIARVGGDEFVVVLLDVASLSEEIVMTRLQKTIELNNAAPNNGINLSLSLGTARFEAQLATPLDEVIARADAIMYESKREKKKLLLTEVPWPQVA